MSNSSEDHFDIETECHTRALGSIADGGEGVGKRGKARAASYEIALGEAQELIVALDCVEIDPLAETAEILAAQDLADRVSAVLTKLIRSV